MTSDRPTAAEVLSDAMENASEGAWWPTPNGTLPLLAALREAVNAGPDDIVCLLPDGTLSVAVSEDGWVYKPADDGDRWDHRFHYEDEQPEDDDAAIAPLFRIPGAKP